MDALLKLALDPKSGPCPECPPEGSPEIDLYTRKSASVSGRRQETSTDVQREIGHQAAHEMNPPHRVRNVWRDILSGFKDITRPGYDHAVAALLGREVPCLWAYKLDRYTRKGAEDMLKIMNAKLRIIFHMDRLDSSVPGHRREIINRSEEARQYSVDLGERLHDAREEYRQRGEWINGQVPYGLKLDPETGGLIPDDASAVPLDPERTETKGDVARDMINLSADGRSARKLRAHLHDRAIPAPRGGEYWAEATISSLLNNPAYAGWQILRQKDEDGNDVPGGRLAKYRDPKGKFVRLKGKALVTDALWDKAKAQRTGRVTPGFTMAGNSAKTGVGLHILTGTGRCVGCKGAMQGGASYRCHLDRRETCPAPAILATHLADEHAGELWIRRVGALENDDPLLHELAVHWQMLQDPETAEQSAEAMAAVKRAEADIEQLARDRKTVYKTGHMAKLWPALVEEAEEALQAAQDALKAAGGGPLALPPFANDPGLAREAWDSADRAGKRELWRLACRVVWISKAPTSKGPQKFDGPARMTVVWHGDESSRGERTKAEQPTS